MILAFASIDPETFQVHPTHVDDKEIYKQFLSLPTSVEKFIGIGGWEFSDPSQRTHRTWSEMVSSSDNRKIFIESLKTFLAEWKFSGVDLHWQWPGVESWGGNPSDLVSHIPTFCSLAYDVLASSVTLRE